MGNNCLSCLRSCGILRQKFPKERTVYLSQRSMNNDKDFKKYYYPTNYIISSRYTIINFLPKNLFEQLQRIANFYFLCIAIIQLFIDSPVSPFTSILPLIVVLTITAVKQGYEDVLRHQADNEENSREYKILKPDGECTKILSCNISVGDIICVENNQPFPCDLFMLSSSDAEGKCSVTTASLDGETNLKVFSCHTVTRDYSQPAIISSQLHGLVRCEQPQEDLYKFNGTLLVADENESGENQKLSLNCTNLLLRGAILRNTEFVWGCALYTGSDTKLSLNSKGKAAKFSQVERRLNGYLFSFMIILLLLASFGCTMKYIVRYYVNSMRPEDAWYMPNEVTNAWRVVQDFFGYLVLFNYLIPISLYVSIELQKFLNSLFFGYDLKMFCRESGSGQELPAKANTSDLNEELGQVEYLFSDKTGTLTENCMVFKECGVAGVKYRVVDDNMHLVSSEDEETILLPEWPSALSHFFELLALCHTVRVESSKEVDENNSIEYQASSPDEKAFVQIAAQFGFVFLGNHDNCQVLDVKSTRKRYRLCQVLEFDSTRKCMSVILEPLQESADRMLMITKGAETAILPRCSQGDKDVVMSQVNDYAAMGLRTLVIAQRYLTREEYAAIEHELIEASTTLENREQKIALVYDTIEQNLSLMGCTGIEDKLQDGVKETIIALRKAGIKVWVLTGDKEETAYNISNAAGHFSPDMVPLRITRISSVEACARRLADHQEFLRLQSDKQSSIAVVVDGQTLNFVLRPELSSMFLQLCQQSSAVLCCRCTPLQKSMVVALVKNGIIPEPVTAAVGDGANDVSMILEAHVGLGIYGKEGRQAVRASDYAVGRFSFLRRALLFHGHYYYQRIAYLVKYFFYKNIVFIFAELYFSFFSAFSFVSVYDAFYLMFFNLTLTALPILVYGLLEQYVPRDYLLDEASLYHTIRRNQHLSWGQFARWVSLAFFHSLVCYFVAHVVFCVNDAVNSDGSSFSLLGLGVIVIETVVITVNFKLLLESYFFSFAVLFGQLLTWFGHLAFIMFYSGMYLPSLFSAELYWTWYKVHSCPVAWLIIFLTISINLLPILIMRAINDQRCGVVFRSGKVADHNIDAVANNLQQPSQAHNSIVDSSTSGCGDIGHINLSYEQDEKLGTKVKRSSSIKEVEYTTSTHSILEYDNSAFITDSIKL